MCETRTGQQVAQLHDSWVVVVKVVVSVVVVLVEAVVVVEIVVSVVVVEVVVVSVVVVVEVVVMEVVVVMTDVEDTAMTWGSTYARCSKHYFRMYNTVHEY